MADPKSGDQDIRLIDMALVLAQNLRLLTVVPLLAGLAALGISFLLPLTYTAETRLMPPQQQSGAAAALLGSLGGLAGVIGAGGGSGGAIAGLKNPADQWVGLLRSRTVADALVSRFTLKALYAVDYQFEARDKLADNTRVSVGKDGLILVEVDDRSPERAAQMANAYVEELQQLSKSLALTEAGQRRVYFEKLLAQARDGLVKAEVALSAGGVNANAIKASPEAAVGELAQLRALIAVQEVRVSVMRGTMTAGNPELQLAVRELSSLRSQLAKAERADPGPAEGDGAQYIARYRDFKYAETLFETMARQYELARADEAKEGAVIQVVDVAQVPEWKSRPKRGLVAVVTTFAAFAACLLFLMARQAWRAAGADPAVAPKVRQLGAMFRRRTRAT